VKTKKDFSPLLVMIPVDESSSAQRLRFNRGGSLIAPAADGCKRLLGGLAIWVSDTCRRF
jgi:hypothetical protein